MCRCGRWSGLVRLQECGNDVWKGLFWFRVHQVADWKEDGPCCSRSSPVWWSWTRVEDDLRAPEIMGNHVDTGALIPFVFQTTDIESSGGYSPW